MKDLLIGADYYKTDDLIGGVIVFAIILAICFYRYLKHREIMAGKRSPDVEQEPETIRDEFLPRRVIKTGKSDGAQ